MTNTSVKQKPQKENVEVRFAKVETTLPFLATKADLSDVRTELKLDISNTKLELKQDIASVKTELSNVKTELKQDIANVKTELSNVRTELKDAINTQTKWFVGFMIPITVGILFKLFIR
ncbi:hypothetical protein [Candidatus Liberibacter sp.]|uniref:hypothetical protein n=1 Tax=Candidatus Liberibacter sp. TaxID=34022 RepID=UPI0015F40DBE|nr:hypothetical protein [Candidatus Liberibacter sp.]MBA5724624.1 hypothetical protein [Candidatus Liberibacter sp.]